MASVTPDTTRLAAPQSTSPSPAKPLTASRAAPSPLRHSTTPNNLADDDDVPDADSRSHSPSRDPNPKGTKRPLQSQPKPSSSINASTTAAQPSTSSRAIQEPSPSPDSDVEPNASTSARLQKVSLDRQDSDYDEPGNNNKPPTKRARTSNAKKGDGLTRAERAMGVTAFPIARVQKIMKADKDLNATAKEGVMLIGRATEGFIAKFTKAAAAQTRRDGRLTLQAKDFAIVAKRHTEFQFAQEIVPMTIPASEAIAKRAAREEETKARQAALAAESGSNNIAKAFQKGKASGGKAKGKANAATDDAPATNGNANGATDDHSRITSTNGIATPASNSAEPTGSSADMDTT